MKSNSRAYNRDVSRRKALRKRRITKEVYGDLTHPYYDNLHQYSKNKTIVHALCARPRVRIEEEDAEKLWNYSPTYNWKIVIA